MGVPFTIRIECAETAFKCDVDLVPAMKFGLDDLPFFTRHRIQNYNLEFGCEITTFLAIALAKADSEKFEIDFHDIERSVLDNQPGAKMVIKGGHFFRLWSHLLKTVVMNEMKSYETGLLMKISKTLNLRTETYWMEHSLENAFLHSLKALRIGLDNGIPDFFFPDYDLMSQIEKVNELILLVLHFSNIRKILP